MQHRRARLAGIAACAVALTAGPAAAETLTYTTPGTTPVTLPTGVARVHVVAVGGRGGGDAGGFGAIVSGDVGVLPPGLPETSPKLLVRVAGNGGIGTGGSNGGGTAGVEGFPTLAGGGGGASTVATFDHMAGSVEVYLNKLLAGGGGGAGAPTLLVAAGAGGAAGAAGGAGSSTASMSAASGGAAGAAGGTGSLTTDPDCVGGENGGGGRSRTGGDGGLSADDSGHGDAGGGGAGVEGGGGGGGGAFCMDGSGTSGAGGGGGSSNVPAGGAITADTTGQPSVQITYELEHPSVTLAVPAEGALYAQGGSIRASFACTAPAALPQDRVASCTGTSASGQRIDTRRIGLRAFTVTTTDAYGLTAEQTVHYDVADLTAPQVTRVRIAPRAIDAAHGDDFATVRFKLSEPASVRVEVHRARGGRRGRRGHAARSHARIVSGQAGPNSFRLPVRTGRRSLSGAYRLTLVATDRAGNRAAPVERRFSVVG